MASVSPFALALSLLSGTCLQTTIGAQGCVLTRASQGASKEKLGLLPTLLGHVQLLAPRVSSAVFLVLWLGLSLSILSLGAGVGSKKYLIYMVGTCGSQDSKMYPKTLSLPLT